MSEQITDVEIATWVAKSLGYNVVEKREVSTDERQALAEKGKAMPDGSFPIANKEDLANAIQSAGRAKDQDAVHAHIIEQAKALGAEDQIPEGWVKKSVEPVAEIEAEVESNIVKSDEEIVETEPEVESEVVKSDEETVEPEAEIESDEVEKSANGLEADHPLFMPAGMDARGDNGLEEDHPLHMKKSETDTFLV